MAQRARETLAHKESKDSTAKWFVFAIIPILNLYWLWKAAEVVSGHEKTVLQRHEVIDHSESKESTAKWFAIFLIPLILLVLGVFAFLGMFIGARAGMTPYGVYRPYGLFGAGFIIFVILGIAGFIAGIYALYKMAESVSGHETVYPGRREMVGHKDVKDSTAKWVVFGIIPILNLYFVWKMSETISGHEEVIGGAGKSAPREPESRPRRETGEGVNYCPNCGSEVGEGVKFCPECGAELKKTEAEERANLCPNCGAEIEPEQGFCTECGAELK